MPAEGASIGEVVVEISPRAVNFWNRFFTETRAGASKAGDDLGSVVGQRIQDKVAPSFAKGVESGTAAAIARGTKLGQDIGDAARRRIEAALKALPQVNLTGDSSELDRKIAEIRAAMAELGDRRVRFDLDSTEATARIAALRAELNALVRDLEKARAAGQNIPVNVDAVKALAEVEALKREIEAIKRDAAKPVKVPVQVDTPQLGAFEKLITDRIGGAIKALPPINLTADSSQVETQLAAVRAELEALQSKRVDVGVDDGVALAKLAELKARLDEIAARSPSARVSVDAGAAASQLAAVQVAIDRVNGRTAHVNVDADTGGAIAGLLALDAAGNRSQFGLTALIATGIAIGPAIVPAAAAAAAAVAAIGTAAIAGAAGLGVGILAFSGVVGAIKNMGAAHDAAGKAATSNAGHMLQVAGAADQIRSAEASLANTRASAADAEIRSVERIRVAEQTLATAQAEFLRAQQAINAAREEARRANEDLASSVAHNATAQRQAVLDQAKAKAALDATLSNPASTSAQREQAQITYDEATQQITDLRVQHNRLAADQAAANKAGIDGSRQVLAAQQTVKSAQDAVAKGERGVADARREAAAQARQSAFQIAQAQQAVISAQRSMQQATIATGTSGSAAMDKLNQSMAALSPQGRAFATFIYGLKGPLDDLRRTAEAGVLPGVQDAITSLLPYLPGFKDFVGGIATTLGDLARNAGQALQSPEWKRFFDYISTTASPLLQTMATIAEDVGRGFAGIIVAFAPITDQFGAGLQGMADRFATWADGLATNPGFQRFITYVQENGPKVVKVLENVAVFVGHVVTALAPFAGPILDGLIAFSDLLTKIPGDDLKIIAGGIILIAAAVGVFNAAMAIAALNPITLIIIGVGAVIAGLVLAYQHFEGFRKVVDATFHGIADVAVWAWNNILKPTFEDLRHFIMDIVVPAALWLWHNAIEPAFKGISAAVSFAWDNIIKPVLAGIEWWTSNVVAPVMLWLWHHVIEPVWAGIHLAIQIGWALIQIVFGLIEIYIKAVLAPVFSWLWHNIIEPVWHGISATISWVWDNLIKPVFNAVGGFIKDTVAPAFKTGVEAIGRAWDGLREAARVPIAFVVNQVINPLIRGYNDIADAFHVGKVKEITGYATGGYIVGPGGPTDDAILARLSAGEFVIPARVVSELGIDFFNQLIGRAGPGTTRPGDGSQGIAIPGFKDGGLVGFFKDVWSAVSDPARLIKAPIEAAITKIPGGGAIRDMVAGMGHRLVDGLLGWLGSGPGGNVKATQEWIKAQNGKPYIWAGAGPEGWDCSGFVGSAYRMLHGQNPYSRIFSTANEAPFFPKPGHGLFTAGWAGPGEKGGGSVGHTAGNLAGLAFESGGALGNVHYGPGSTSVDTFAHVGHYDKGGKLPPGLTLAMNETGKSEWVFTDDQLRAFNGANRATAFTVTLAPKDGASAALLEMIDVRIEEANDGVARQVANGPRY